ncbi:MAG TPA: invasion associated locus B family protein [Rhizomicrobium sp.]|nr:invasion associated locus B family protein [Rhizomicrobium sp.]
MIRMSAFLLSAVLLTTPAMAQTQPATLLGVFQNWSAYSSGSGSSMTCYALSTPRATQPRGASRGPIYLMVSDWPGRKVKAEPQIVLGYSVKADSPAALAVGSTKFAFFSRPNGPTATANGAAWLQSLSDNSRLIDTMSRGVSAVATGISARGTRTTDTYSLAGFSDAMAKIHDICKM